MGSGVPRTLEISRYNEARKEKQRVSRRDVHKAQRSDEVLQVRRVYFSHFIDALVEDHLTNLIFERSRERIERREEKKGRRSQDREAETKKGGAGEGGSERRSRGKGEREGEGRRKSKEGVPRTSLRGSSRGFGTRSQRRSPDLR